jgi:hypothetical protein
VLGRKKATFNVDEVIRYMDEAKVGVGTAIKDLGLCHVVKGKEKPLSKALVAQRVKERKEMLCQKD